MSLSRIPLSLAWLLLSLDLGQAYVLPLEATPSSVSPLWNTTAIRKSKGPIRLGPVPSPPSLADQFLQLSLRQNAEETECKAGYFNCTPFLTDQDPDYTAPECCTDGGVCCEEGYCCDAGEECIAIPNEYWANTELGCCKVGVDCVLPGCPSGYTDCVAIETGYCCPEETYCDIGGSDGAPVCINLYYSTEKESPVSATSSSVSLQPEYTPSLGSSSFGPPQPGPSSEPSPGPSSEPSPGPGGTGGSASNGGGASSANATPTGSQSDSTNLSSSTSGNATPTGSQSDSTDSSSGSSGGNGGGLSTDGLVGLLVGVVGVLVAAIFGIPTVWFAWLTWHDNHRPGESWKIMKETVMRRAPDQSTAAYKMVHMTRT